MAENQKAPSAGNFLWPESQIEACKRKKITEEWRGKIEQNKLNGVLRRMTADAALKIVKFETVFAAEKTKDYQVSVTQKHKFFSRD